MADNDQNSCCQCDTKVSDSCVGYNCQSCSRLFYNNFSRKVHPSDSPRRSPEPPSLQPASVRHSSGRSDEDEADDSAKNFFSPYSLANVTINAVHPGIVKTGIIRDHKGFITGSKQVCSAAPAAAAAAPAEEKKEEPADVQILRRL